MTAQLQQLTLISHPLCPFVQRVAILLAEKGISFERINIDLVDKPDWFLALSPTGKVPLLRVHQDDVEVVLFESIAICEYVEEAYPSPSLHPQNMLARASHRAWIEFASSMLTDAWGYLNASDKETATAKRTLFRNKLECFEVEIADGPYFAGSHFSMVDAVVAPIYRYFDILNHTIIDDHIFGNLPNVSRWRRELAQRNSVKTTVVHDYAARFHAHLIRNQALLAKEWLV
ncbi:TPA: glutathione S-transferase family protein [Yersinia enterocolitica]